MCRSRSLITLRNRGTCRGGSSSFVRQRSPAGAARPAAQSGNADNPRTVAATFTISVGTASHLWNGVSHDGDPFGRSHPRDRQPVRSIVSPSFRRAAPTASSNGLGLTEDRLRLDHLPATSRPSWSPPRATASAAPTSASSPAPRSSSARPGKRPPRETGRNHLSVELDDPSFPAPIYASRVEDEGGEAHDLIWSRRTGDRGRTPPKPRSHAGLRFPAFA